MYIFIYLYIYVYIYTYMYIYIYISGSTTKLRWKIVNISPASEENVTNKDDFPRVTPPSDEVKVTCVEGIFIYVYIGLLIIYKYLYVSTWKHVYMHV
jgi:hypothetical protein